MPSFDALHLDENWNRMSLILQNYWYITWDFHYSDVIMSVMVSQITGVSIVCWTVCSGSDQRKHQSSASLVFVGEFTVDQYFPSQRASDVENVSIWWRHHVFRFARLSSEYNYVLFYNSDNTLSSLLATIMWCIICHKPFCHVCNFNNQLLWDGINSSILNCVSLILKALCKLPFVMMRYILCHIHGNVRVSESV